MPLPTREPIPYPAADDDDVSVWFAQPVISAAGKIGFFAQDSGLGLIHSCVATWLNVPVPPPPPDPPMGLEGVQTFNVATGAPAPTVFSLNEGCRYDKADPPNTPLISGVPAPDAHVNGRDSAPDSVNPNNGEIKLVQVIPDNARVEIRFYFDAVDAYSAASERARVTTDSDSVGEWAAIREVSVGTGALRTAAAKSGRFGGEVGVSASTSARAQGDGDVYAPADSYALTLAYMNADGSVRRSANAAVTPTPTGTITPSATPTPSTTPTLTPTATSTLPPTAEERRIAVSFANEPRASGDTVVFHIEDNHLGTTTECRAVWSSVANDIAKYNHLSLATGEPEAATFSLTGCVYDPKLPIAFYPRPQVLVDNAASDTSDLDVVGWRISFSFDVDAGDPIEVNFHHELFDAFPAHAKRARVYSSSDRAGEWVAIQEVASKADASAAPASDLYRGEVKISRDEASLASGDGKVFVRRTSRLTVAYYTAGGETRLDSDTLHLALPTATPTLTPTATPVPTPLPASNRLTLILIAAALSGLMLISLCWQKRETTQRR